MEAASITETASEGPPARKVSDVLNAYALPVLLVLALVAQFVYSPQDTLDDVKTGLSNGTIWALIALGYTLVYGIVELHQLRPRRGLHDRLVRVGVAVGDLRVDEQTAMPLTVVSIVVVLVLAMLASGTLNVLIERVAYRPLRNAPKLAPLITAIGMSFILQNVGLLWRPTPDSAPDLIGSQDAYFTIFGVGIEHSDVFAVVVTVPLLMALLWFVGSTRYGKGHARDRAGSGRGAPNGDRR